MKKFAISLLALAAVSTAALADDRGHDLYSSGAGYPTQLNDTSTDSNALAAVNEKTGALTAFELASQNAAESVRSTSN